MSPAGAFRERQAAATLAQGATVGVPRTDWERYEQAQADLAAALALLRSLNAVGHDDMWHECKCSTHAGVRAFLRRHDAQPGEQ